MGIGRCLKVPRMRKKIGTYKLNIYLGTCQVWYSLDKMSKGKKRINPETGNPFKV